MVCREVLETAARRLSEEVSAAEAADLSAHLAVCSACRDEVRSLERTWRTLDEPSGAGLPEAFVHQTLALLERETALRRTRRESAAASRRGRPASRADRAVAGGRRFVPLLGACAAGFLLARLGAPSPPPAPGKEPRLGAAPVDFPSPRPRGLPAGGLGDFNGAPPADREVGPLFAHLLSATAATDGARGQAIDLVSHYFRERAVPPAEVVAALADRLRLDRNPGVRKRAAVALAQLPPSPASQAALLAALRSDANPGVRMVVLEALMKTSLRDPTVVETLRETATDPAQSGYLRFRAATALREVDL